MTYFISGIDTGIGKTVATGLMCRYLQAQGRRWISVKMVQTGCDGFSEDLDEHRRIAGVGRFPEDESGLTAPQVFKFPSSPELAARLEGRAVDLERIAASVAECEKSYDVVLVEGAGGLCVPLAPDVLAVDFAAARGWPLVLVGGGRLGSLNHILLSLEAAEARGMELAGFVYNSRPPADPVVYADTLATVRRRLAARGLADRVVELPALESGATPDFGPLFGGSR